jgi:hypothetical protein
MNGYLPITTWEGTELASKATEGERFWYVEVIRDYINSDKGAIVSRSLPVGWPYFAEGAFFALGRFGEMGYNYEPGYGDIGVGWYRNNSDITKLDLQLWWYQAAPSAALSQIQVFDSIPSGFSNNTVDFAIAPLHEPILGGMSWNGRDVSVLWDGEMVNSTTRAAYIDTDFPFFNVENEEEPLLLYQGHPPGYWTNSMTLGQDVAIFNRPLTDTELAFLNDPDSIWSYNMFAEPDAATVAGIPTEVYRGDTCRFSVTVKDADGDAVPLYGSGVWFTLKRSTDISDSGDDDAVVQCVANVGADGSYTGENVDSVDAGEGVVTFAFEVPFVTGEAMGRTGWRVEPQSETFYYDVQIVGMNGNVTTLAYDTLTVSPEVTRSA